MQSTICNALPSKAECQLTLQPKIIPPDKNLWHRLSKTLCPLYFLSPPPFLESAHHPIHPNTCFWGFFFLWCQTRIIPSKRLSNNFPHGRQQLNQVNDVLFFVNQKQCVWKEDRWVEWLWQLQSQLKQVQIVFCLSSSSSSRQMLRMTTVQNESKVLHCRKIINSACQQLFSLWWESGSDSMR